MRHLAWLQAKPKKQDKSRRETLKDTDSPLLELPRIEGFSFLLDYLFEFGPTQSTGMGIIPVTFLEIKSWASVTDIDLTPWEGLALQRLSCDYLGEYNQADDPQRPAPYCKELSFDEHKLVNDKLGSWLRSFKQLKR